MSEALWILDPSVPAKYRDHLYSPSSCLRRPVFDVTLHLSTVSFGPEVIPRRPPPQHLKDRSFKSSFITSHEDVMIKRGGLGWSHVQDLFIRSRHDSYSVLC